jgi:hypothetical protein
MAPTKTAVQAVTAFCATCPAPEAVTAFLLGLGLHLALQMEAVHYAAYQQLPELPAQYHYQAKGTEVIYLAGEDSPLDDECLPRHASRFWAYPGADAEAFQQIIWALAVSWSLTWQRLDHTPSPGGKHITLSVLSCCKEHSA